MPLYEKSGVVNASTDVIPKGTAVHKIQGLNFPHLLFVLSANAPIIGWNPIAAAVPTKKMIAVASSAFKPLISV